MHVKYTWNAPWTHILLDVHYRICVYSCAAGSGYSPEARKIYCILRYIERIFNYILDNVVYSQVSLEYIDAIYCEYTLNISENIKYRYTFYQRIYSLNIVKYLLSLRNILYSKECTKEYTKNTPLITNPHFDNKPPWSLWTRDDGQALAGRGCHVQVVGRAPGRVGGWPAGDNGCMLRR